MKRDTNGTSSQVASYYSEQYDAGIDKSWGPEPIVFQGVVLMEQGNHFGAIPYTELQARGQIARFS